MNENYLSQYPIIIPESVSEKFIDNQEIEIDSLNLFDISKRAFSNSSFPLTHFEEYRKDILGIKIYSNLDYYKMNNIGLRCDSFFKDSKNTLLFAGDSFAFGEGLPYKQNWSGILFEKMNRGEGYVCLSYPGASIELIVKKIFYYLKEYEFPECVFVLFPSSTRKSFEDNNKELVCVPPIENRDLINKLWSGDQANLFFAKEQISLLSNKLKELGIKFVWSCWDSNDLRFFDQNPINGYVSLNNFQIEKMSDKPTIETKKIYKIARDGSHPGVMYNSAIANIFREAYNDK